MSINQVRMGEIGQILEVQATRAHVSGRKESFRVFLAVTPDMVKCGGRFRPGVAMTAAGDRLKLTPFEREYIEFCMNEGNAMSSSTSECSLDDDPVFSFEVVKMGERPLRQHAPTTQLGQACFC